MPFFVLHLGVCIIIGVSCISKLAQYVPPCKAFGVFILIYRDDIFQSNSISLTLESQLLVILGSTLYSFAAIYGKKYKITNPVNASTGTILFATFFMTIYLLFIDETKPDISMLLIDVNILLLGILCTAIATVIYFQILQTSGASFLSIMKPGSG